MSSTNYYEASEDILVRMKEDITEVNTSEGSFVHDSQAPVSVELSNTKLQLNEVLKKVFASSAYENEYSEFLERRCADYGVTRKAGGKATGYVTFTGQAGASIPSGTIVATQTGLRYFTVDSAVIPEGATTVKVQVEAEDIGASYNKIANTITYMPIKLINITSVTNEEAFENGYDEESDEDLYNRYCIKVQKPATSANENQFLIWALDVTGVGNAKILPLWNGNGTIKVVIINSNKVGADSTLVNAVSAYLEEVRPICSGVITVVSATELPININVNLSIDTNNYTLETVKNSITTNITSYLKDIAFEKTYVSYAQIGSLILDTAGVKDYSNLTINNGTANVPILDTQVAVMGSVVANNA